MKISTHLIKICGQLSSEHKKPKLPDRLCALELEVAHSDVVPFSFVRPWPGAHGDHLCWFHHQASGQAGDLWDTQLRTKGPWRLACLNLPRGLVLKRSSHLNLLGDPPVQGSQEVVTPWPAQGPNTWEANLPWPAWGFNLQEAVMPQPAWGSAPWPGDAWLSGCNSTG